MEFRKAIKLFLDPAPERRGEGEKLLRRMGKRAVDQARVWISQAEEDLARVRSLLWELGGPGEEALEPLAAARPFFSKAVAGAWERFHAGDYADAKRTAESVLRLDPESPELWQLRRLIRQCEDRLISREVLEPTLEFRTLVYGAEEEPHLLFRLVNRSRASVSVQAERGLLGNLQVSLRRRYLDGSQRNDDRTVMVRTAGGEEKFGLEPGGSYEREVVIRVDEPRPNEEMVLRIRVVGRFQPSRWGVEDKNVSRTLSLPPTECWVVAPGQKPLADVPLKKLETALFFRNLHSFFTGGQLAVWAAEDDLLLNERLLHLLVGSLGELDEVGIRVADGLLEDSSGVRRDRKIDTPAAIAEHWKRWWSDRRRAQGEASEAPSPVPKLLDRPPVKNKR